MKNAIHILQPNLDQMNSQVAKRLKTRVIATNSFSLSCEILKLHMQIGPLEYFKHVIKVQILT